MKPFMTRLLLCESIRPVLSTTRRTTTGDSL